MTFRNWRDATKILETAQLQISTEISQKTCEIQRGITMQEDTFDLDMGYAILITASRHLHINYLVEQRQAAAGKYVDAIFHRTRNL